MPGDLCAFWIALDERLDELRRRNARKLGPGCAHRLEPVRDRFRIPDHAAPLVVVVDAEVPRSAFRDDAVHADLVELERLDLVEQPSLVVRRQHVGAVDQARREAQTFAGTRSSVSADSPRRSWRLRSASALISTPSSSATLLSQSHVSITTTADSEPQVLLYDPNLLT